MKPLMSFVAVALVGGCMALEAGGVALDLAVMPVRGPWSALDALDMK